GVPRRRGRLQPRARAAVQVGGARRGDRDAALGPAGLEAFGAVVGQRLPRREGADVEVRLRAFRRWLVECREAHARVLRLGPAAAEEVGAARRAERLRAALVRLERAAELLALQDRDR